MPKFQDMSSVKQTYPLHDLRFVNTVIQSLYDKEGKYRPGFKPEEFYNAILLDTLKYGEENYVHLKYCETINVKKGQKTAKFRRWSGMTPTLRPLREGLPPMPDKHAYETMEVGNVFSFGRWSEYTDEIDKSVISDIVSERSIQYGENASQVKELYARKTWLASPNAYFANFKTSESDLAFGDKITLDDLRFLVQRMKRVQVKPAEGSRFNYICSPEFIQGLYNDPRVKQYMAIEQTTGNLFTTGEPFALFELNFIPTMLDEFAYPDVEFPGVYDGTDDHQFIRYYGIEDKTVYIATFRDDFAMEGNTTIRTSFTGYLTDGTAVEDQYMWSLNDSGFASTDFGNAADNSKATLVVQTISYATDHFGNKTTTFTKVDTVTNDHKTAAANLIKAGSMYQLPIHRGILFGDEAMVKINMEGLSDAPQIIIKELGSSGVADPLNQRQSIGYRVDGFGLAIKRPEAICITYSIPENAEFAALTSAYYQGQPIPLFNEASANDANRFVEGTGYYDDVYMQNLRVDAINAAPGQITPHVIVDGTNNSYSMTEQIMKGEYDNKLAYKTGDIVTIGSKVYKFTKDVNANVDLVYTGDNANVEKLDTLSLYKNLLPQLKKN